MCNGIDQRLLDLCRRDEIAAVRDQARRAAAAGDEQAGFVVAWMDELLSRNAPATNGGKNA